uniref:Uncharacterized protein n=1 Tax=Arundo donax TaxID=35708 RepID=A0A0A9A6J8_ARUDO
MQSFVFSMPQISKKTDIKNIKRTNLALKL